MQLTDGDVQDFITNGSLIPSFFVNGPIWAYEVDPACKPHKIEGPAADSGRLMYVVSFQHTSASDGYFRFVADTHDALRPGGLIYRLNSSGYTTEDRIPLSAVNADGVVMREEVERFSTVLKSTPEVSSSAPATPGGQWWNKEYVVSKMADDAVEYFKSVGHGPNQSGSRAGLYAFSKIGNRIAAEIEKVEKSANRTRKIGGKRITDFLKTCAWTEKK